MTVLDARVGTIGARLTAHTDTSVTLTWLDEAGDPWTPTGDVSLWIGGTLDPDPTDLDGATEFADTGGGSDPNVTTHVLSAGAAGSYAYRATVGDVIVGIGQVNVASSLGTPNPSQAWTVSLGSASATFQFGGPPGPAGSVAVDSVNGQTGVVVLDATDVGADPVGTAAGLVGAITPGDIGAEVAGAASVVAGDLTDHENENTAAHGGIVADTDPRLTDARTPTAHSHAQSDVTGLDTALGAKADTASLGNSAGLDVGTTAGTVAAGDDARLSDARTPTAHTHSANDITSDTLDVARLPVGTGSTQVAAGNHTHTAADVGAIAIAAGVTVIDAGDDLATARPSGIGVAYWLFDDDSVDVGTGGADIVNGVPGDLWFVPDA